MDVRVLAKVVSSAATTFIQMGSEGGAAMPGFPTLFEIYVSVVLLRAGVCESETNRQTAYLHHFQHPRSTQTADKDSLITNSLLQIPMASNTHSMTLRVKREPLSIMHSE